MFSKYWGWHDQYLYKYISTSSHIFAHQSAAAFISLPMAALYEQGVVHTVLSSVYSIDYCICQKKRVQNDSFTLKNQFSQRKSKSWNYPHDVVFTNFPISLPVISRFTKQRLSNLEFIDLPKRLLLILWS